MDVYSTFQSNLANELSKQNKQQKQLAEYLGIKPTRISDWIRTESNPKLTHLAGTSKFLNVSLDYLLLNKEKKEVDEEILTTQEKELLSNFRNLEFKEQIEVLYFILKFSKRSK